MASSFENLRISLKTEPRNFDIIKNYDDDFTGHAELGDLILVKRKGCYHAGVCCSEDEEIIHFTLKDSGSFLPSGGGTAVSGFSSLTHVKSVHDSLGSALGLASGGSSVSFYPGFVSKVSIDDFHRGDKFAIYKKIGGIPSSFRENVRRAMRTKHEYNLLQYNRIHFAMELLEVKTSEGDVEELLRLLDLL